MARYSQKRPCKAHCKRKKDDPKDKPLEPCKGFAVHGWEVCRMHGARGGGPIKTGRYSKHLGRIAESYEAALADKALLDLREPIAALDAIVRRLAERVEELDTPDYRQRLMELLSESKADDADKAYGARAQLEELIERGADEDRTLAVLRDSLSELAKRIEGAWKVKLDKKHALGAAEQRVLIARFLDLVAQEFGVEASIRVGRRFRGEVLGIHHN